MSYSEDKIKILVIGPNPADAAKIELCLRDPAGSSFEVATVPTASAGVKYLTANNVDIAVLDISPVDRGGAEAFNQLLSSTTGLPIIVISDSTDEAIAVGLAKRGAKDYLIKDRLDRDVLVRSVRYAIERYNLEKQLFQSQKMEQLGRLAGGVAHDFNNILTVILGSVDFIKLSKNEPVALGEFIDEIRLAAKRGSQLTQRLLIFSRLKVTQHAFLFLNRIVRDTEKMLSRLIPKNIALKLEFEEDLGIIKAERGQVEQVLVNLVVNAVDAMPDGGQITIRTRNVVVDESTPPPDKDIAFGPFVLLEVADTGCGIEKTNLAKIFDPFFTTKISGKGSGLGLSVVFGIVKQTGGFITVRTELGKGSTFSVHLPQTAEEYRLIDRGYGETTVFPRRITGSETLLIVEDDDPLRNMICKFLQMNGYRVLQATSGDQAMELCDKHQDNVHLLFVDLMLPGTITGLDLADRLSKKYPELRVLYTSGYKGKAVSQGFEPGLVFLEKPYRLGDLSIKIRQLLELKEPVK